MPNEREIPKCQKCGNQLLMAELCVYGYPDYHVEGSRRMYCGTCDEPPTMTLDSNAGSFRIRKNPSQSEHIKNQEETIVLICRQRTEAEKWRDEWKERCSIQKLRADFFQRHYEQSNGLRAGEGPKALKYKGE